MTEYKGGILNRLGGWMRNLKTSGEAQIDGLHLAGRDLGISGILSVDPGMLPREWQEKVTGSGWDIEMAFVEEQSSGKKFRFSFVVLKDPRNEYRYIFDTIKGGDIQNCNYLVNSSREQLQRLELDFHQNREFRMLAIVREAMLRQGIKRLGETPEKH